MKNAVLIMLLPIAAFAQTNKAEVADCKPFLKVHFKELKMTDKIGPSCMTVFDGDFLLTDTLPAQKLPAKHHSKKFASGYHADSVAISYNYSPVLRGDVMEYDNVQKKAILKGHITLSREGKDEPIGEYARVDLSDNRYVIEKLK